MNKIKSTHELTMAIHALEQKKAFQRHAIENEINSIRQSLCVGNILKSAVEKVINKDSLTAKTVGSVLVLGSGFVAQKVIAGKSKNIFRKLLARIVQLTVAGLVAKQANKIVFKSPGFGKAISFTRQHAND